MLYTYSTEKLLGLQGVNITKVEESDQAKYTYIELERKEQTCPSCSNKTNTVHDYRTQRVKDIPVFGKSTVVVLKKRRYRCPHCNKRFAEDNSFLPILSNAQCQKAATV